MPAVGASSESVKLNMEDVPTIGRVRARTDALTTRRFYCHISRIMRVHMTEPFALAREDVSVWSRDRDGTISVTL